MAHNTWCVLPDDHKGTCQDESARRVIQGAGALARAVADAIDPLAKRVDELERRMTEREASNVETLGELLDLVKLVDRIVTESEAKREALETRFRDKLAKVHQSSIDHKAYLNSKVDEIVERLEAFAKRLKAIERGRRGGPNQ